MTEIQKHPEFSIHCLEGSINNIFLIKYADKILLIDGGVTEDIGIIKSYCEEHFKCSPEKITLSIVSHMHPDHVGGAYQLRENYGVPIAAHKDVSKWYRGFSGFLQYRLDCFMTVSVGKRQNKNINNVGFDRTLRPDYFLTDKKPLPFFNDWQALHIPGHTRHDATIWHPDKKILYGADMVIGMRSSFDLPMPLLFKKKMKASYKKLARLSPETLLLSHGERLVKENIRQIFLSMIKQIDRPLTKLSKSVHILSWYSPEFWTYFFKKKFNGAFLHEE